MQHELAHHRRPNGPVQPLMDPGPDQRRFFRLPRHALVEFSELKWGREPHRTGMVQNVSAAGILIRSSAPLPLGTSLRLQLDLSGIERFRPGFIKPGRPDQQRLVVLGRIVRVEEVVPDTTYDLGVVFVNIDPDDQEALMAYVESKKSATDG